MCVEMWSPDLREALPRNDDNQVMADALRAIDENSTDPYAQGRARAALNIIEASATLRLQELIERIDGFACGNPEHALAISEAVRLIHPAAPED